METKLEKFYFCSCGTEQGQSHNFRHIFTPECTVEKYTRENNKGDVLRVDCTQFPVKINKGKCTYFQCNKDEAYHKSGITLSHEFQGTESRLREVFIRVPRSTRCSECNIPKGSHNVKHRFHLWTELVNLTDDDIVTVPADVDFQDILDSKRDKMYTHLGHNVQLSRV